ncbi:ABC transporter ATP-binding protein [Brevibacillus fluminis]|uniref:ABC transporter ATP-binding protein n=1 Tax=Brevibacillus fluminis TaxID=511487 RepID=UPI003F8C1FBE
MDREKKHETVVQLRNVSKKIGLKTIVDNVSFDIPRGTVFGLLGPNGAGKTSLIRMMVGLTSISQGDITIRGASVKREFERAIRHVGAIVENPDMYRFLSGYKNLLHSANMLPAVDKKRIKEVIALVGLESSIHQKVKTYSLGMRQRLGIAQALLHRPAVLILDEPTNGLDPAGIRELRNHLRHLAEMEGTAVIVSSHLLAEMELMCDEIAVLQKGKLIGSKSMAELMDNQTAAETIRIETEQPLVAKEILQREAPAIRFSLHGQTLTAKMTREQIPNVIATLVYAGIPLLEVKREGRTLEDTFLEMTRGE